ncbi:hypothetical protein FNL65_21890 [Pseudomonas aeruginosa]|uniref:hypothetical protein n=1 Tax=Pseudomonas aeruginosa TaxID=287 RepID=UPI00115DC5A6|nr:hypothetical protein [Pseudomonas aeruginosa]TRM01015.1 hypothetical protein FNL65_21890 [Pseudomonas aeruginosa]
MSNCSHEAWDFGALQCPDCGAVKGHVADADYAKLEAEAQALREEVAALRARVAVVPDASTVYAALDARERLFTSPENIQVALEAQSRLNGLTVSEGLLRRIVTPALTSSDAQDRIGALEELVDLLPSPVSASTVRRRLATGMSLEDALLSPHLPPKPGHRPLQQVQP